MESREEIEAMRVIDLREFLRRHGHPMKPVMRETGTPGPMRKSELLEAALEIYDEHKEGKPSPSRPSSAAETSPPNPFQSGIPTPEKRQSDPSSSTDDRPPDTPAEPPAERETPKKESETPAKSRRRSAAWVDPVLLAQMRATTPTKPNDAPSRARPIAPRPSPTGAQQFPSRVLPESSPIRPPQRIVRPSGAETPSRLAQRAPARVPTITRKPAPMSRMPLTPRRLALQKPDPEPRSRKRDKSSRREVKQVVDVPPPPAPSRVPAVSEVVPPPEKRLLALDIDEDYVSEEDPDYDADAEEVDADDLDYTNFDDDVDYVVDVDQAGPAPRYMNDVFDAVPAIGQDSIDVDVDIQEDIPIDSDHYRSESALESDPGSTIETEDDDQGRNFANWSTADVKAWLRDHDVNFRPAANRDVLVSVARAHALHLEATASTRRDSDLQIASQGEDEILPGRSAETNVRRGRIIAPPWPDDDSDIVEIEPAPSSATTRRVAKTSKREFVYNRKPARVEPRRRQPFFALLPLVVLFVFLCSSGFVALSVLKKHLLMTYCDTNATSTTLDNGMECRPCPRNGRCIGGLLRCDPGFGELRGRCLEDKEFNLFSEKLAYSAFELMSELAGRAQCGEDVPQMISLEELTIALQSLYTRRRQPFDERKFEDAMAKAILTLKTDDAFDVTIYDNGYLSSNVPKFSIKCTLKKKLWEYKRALLITVGAFILIIYVRLKRYFQELHERRLNEAHASALEYLRDQVNGYRNNEEDVAFVPDVMLREEVVGRPTPENKKFWKEVEERLNRDARVMRKHQVLKGMPSYTFEYVGSRRVSGGRNSGTFFESLRRSSFGSRTSLDSFDLGQEANAPREQRRSFLDLFLHLFRRNTD